MYSLTSFLTNSTELKKSASTSTEQNEQNYSKTY